MPLTLPPDFRGFPYIHTTPAGAVLLAWTKLQEAERRLAVYRWAESCNDPSAAEHRILLSDAVSAFLMTIEAALQFVRDEVFDTSKEFYSWLEQESAYDLPLRGVRTLRHFEAHVETKPAAGHITVVLGGPTIRRWALQELHDNDLTRLYHPSISADELEQWNALVRQAGIAEVFQLVVSSLAAIVLAAETRHSGAGSVL